MKRFKRRSLGLLCFALIGVNAFSNNAPSIIAAKSGDGFSIEIKSNQTTVFQSPKEGLWSIATAWENDWPAGWLHASPTQKETVGEWMILSGELETPKGNWKLRDAYRIKGTLIECRRRFEWHGKSAAHQTTLSARFQSPGTGSGVVMPGILYYGNPSGAASGKVPVYSGKPGEEALYEEHRFPMPFVSLEWMNGDQRLSSALHSMPSMVPHGNLRDQWWSLGVAARDNATEFMMLSGPCASNGKRSVIKARQPGFSPYPDAYMNIPPNAIIEKNFYLETVEVQNEGSGFQPPTQRSLDIFTPYSTESFMSYREIIDKKYQYALTRWFDNGETSGFRKYPNRNEIVCGWCGQAAALGYALQVLEENLNDLAIPGMVQKSLDFLTQAKFYEKGFHTWFNPEKKEWTRDELLSQGQSMLNFARAINAAKLSNYDTSKWETFLKKTSDFHAKRILSEDWLPISTNEGFFIAPLCYAHRTFNDPLYLQAAEKAGAHYAERHVNMREPYWGGTLDASCEDKEGAFAALQGFLELYDTTKDKNYLSLAKHACDVALTYVVVWDIDLPPGRLRDHNFKTRGWTAVSPQNQHIDVFGVLIAPDVYRVGQHMNLEGYKKLSHVMIQSCGQLIDPYGSQGEQPQQTNYAQRGEVEDISELRGGYNETWTVFWITAHFLNAAAQMQELGVEIWNQ